jgi:ubiquinone/menaquinone biosynthesis C-methylase UbiE
MERILTAELLDEDRGTPAEIAASLDDLWRINRWLGGVRSNLRMLERVFDRAGSGRLSILDVGTGDARLAARLASALGRRKLRAEFVALDRRHSHLRNSHPRRLSLPLVAADVAQLPFRENSFQVVMCNLFLHHFSGERAQELLRQMARVASVALIVNDLERNWLPYLFIRVAYPFARSRITRYDGPASVRQAYTEEELCQLARRAGFEQFEVARLGSFRLGLTLWKAGRGARA